MRAAPDQRKNHSQHCNVNEANEANWSHKARINWNQHMAWSVCWNARVLLSYGTDLSPPTHRSIQKSLQFSFIHLECRLSCSACGNFCNYSAPQGEAAAAPDSIASCKCECKYKGGWAGGLGVWYWGKWGMLANAHLNISFCDVGASAA